MKSRNIRAAGRSRLLKGVATGGVFTLGVGLAGLAQGQQATTQETEEKDKEQSQELSEVTVTGSRITISGFSSPNPITVLDRETIDALGIVNIGEAVGQLPANNPQVSAVNTSVGSVNDYVTGSNIGAQLANLRGLNPFFGSRTLTLVDGHRFVPSTNGGSVDLGLIPSNLVSRTEIVTGGASAAYGSDAVAGVVNVVLDHDLKGVRAQADFSGTPYGDGKDSHFAVAAGTSLFGGRGHIIAGGEYDDAKGIGACTSVRSKWCKPYAIFNTPAAYEATYPDYYLTDNARATVTPGGSIIAMTSFQSVTTAPAAAFVADSDYSRLPATLRNKQFNDAGTGLVNWQTGDFISPANRVMVGGEGLPQDFGTQLRVPVERKTLYSRLQYDLTDRIEGFVEGSFGQRTTDREQVGLQYSILGTTTSGALIKGSTCTTATVTVTCAPNAFIPASVRALMDINGNGVYNQGIDKDGFYIGKANTAFPAPIQHSNNKTYRGVIGAKGSFLETFKWDAYYTYGKNKQAQALENARKDSRGATNSVVLGLPRLTGACQAAATRATGMTAAEATTCNVNQWTVSPFDFAIDSIVDNETVITPGTGQIVCRATLNASAAVRNLASGCVPLNLLGTSNASPQALAYAFGTEYENFEYTQNAVGWNLQGAPIQGWASPIAFAVGMEYRKDESATTHPDPQNFWAPDFGGDFLGSTKVIEGYVETQFALLRDVPMARSLDFDAAYRRTRNESAAVAASKKFDINTWKVNLQWSPVDWLRFRATRSADVRAPSFRELFFPGRDTPSFPVANPWTGVNNNVDILRNGGGNYDLKPEQADTWTVGLVFQPAGFLEGLRLSVDAYDIKLKDGIAPVSTGGITAACYASQGTDPLCDKIVGVGDPVTGFQTITSITSGSLNAESFKTRGIDFEVFYRFGLDSLVPSWRGNMSLRVLSSYLKDLTLESSKRNAPTATAGLQGGVGTNYAGQVGSGGVDDSASFSEAPNWQSNATLTYTLDRFKMTLQARYVGSAALYVDLIGPDDPRYTPALVADASTAGNKSINKNTIGSYTNFNFSASYEFDWGSRVKAEMFGVVRNLFDREPAIAPPIPPGGGYTPTNAVFYDMIGRMYQAGVRVKF